MQNDFNVPEEELAAKIQALVSSLRADNKPEELDKIKKIIKKNVPFTLRGYFSAYLLRELLSKPQTHTGRPERVQRERAEKKPAPTATVREEKKSAAVQQPSQPKAEKSEKKERVLPPDAKTLYLNIGKMGHVYARDIIALITEEGSITKDDIYSIRLHDKYSFISMSEENCNKAIAHLQGKSFKNRTIQINISNKEKKSAQSAKENGGEADGSADPVQA